MLKRNEDMNDITSIEDVKIADLDFKISISKSQRDSLIKAAAEINQRIKDYKKQYEINDRSQLLAMTLIKLATDFEVYKKEAGEDKTEALTHQQTLLSKLTDYINKQ